MTKFDRILQSMSVADYATMQSDANKCPSTRMMGQCAWYKTNHERSTMCFFCWKDWLLEEDEE